MQADQYLRCVAWYKAGCRAAKRSCYIRFGNWGPIGVNELHYCGLHTSAPSMPTTNRPLETDCMCSLKTKSDL